jgi:hypothetical protein
LQQKQGKFILVSIFLERTVTKYSPFCAIFLNVATNTQQSTEKEGEIKATWEKNLPMNASGWLPECLPPQKEWFMGK